MAITASTQPRRLRGVVALFVRPSAALGVLAVGKQNFDFAVPELRQGDRVLAAMLQNVDANTVISAAAILTDAAADGSGGQVRIQLNAVAAAALTVDPQDIVLLVARAGGEGV